jgi:hypothetical protein
MEAGDDGGALSVGREDNTRSHHLMIPRITHSRSQLQSHFNEYEDGAQSFFVSSDTYPDLFALRYPQIVAKAPKGWRQKKMKYLWFPSGALDEGDLQNITEWREKFGQYVLLGLNRHIEGHFKDELDFCMALDLNYDPLTEKRTIFGEAEYQLKYQKSPQHFQVLGNALIDAIGDLPIPPDLEGSYCITSIPCPPDRKSIACRLASAVAKKIGEKIPIWEKLYAADCVKIAKTVQDRLIIVIDDLYQSGVTLWMYAKFLKQQGAAHVIGLPCVKSRRDSDNQ